MYSEKGLTALSDMKKDLQCLKRQTYWVVVMGGILGRQEKNMWRLLKSPSAALSLRFLRSTYAKSMLRLKPCSAPCLIPAGTGLHMELFTLPLDTNELRSTCENR